MSDKEFLIKYEELLDKGYCDCNEMNCIDNNSPRRILNIAKKLQQENQQLKIQISAREENYKKLEVLVECLKLGITLNQEQEELLDKTLFERGVSDDNDC